MPTVFEFYYYSGYKNIDTWWEAAHESGIKRTEDEEWWN